MRETKPPKHYHFVAVDASRGCCLLDAPIGRLVARGLAWSEAMKKQLRIISGTIVVAVLAFLAYSYLTNHSTPLNQPPLAEVSTQNFELFRQEFNRTRGRVRIIALFSPT
jgi:hypothetical protein